MTYWQSPAFKALQRAWYAELERDGFEDAEQLVAGDMVMKAELQDRPYRFHHVSEIMAKEEYFLTLTQKVSEGSFHSEVDRTILLMFIEGAKISQICRALADRGNARCRATVRYTIRKYEVEWGLREYTPQQLNKYPRRSA